MRLPADRRQPGDQLADIVQPAGNRCAWHGNRTLQQFQRLPVFAAAPQSRDRVLEDIGLTRAAGAGIHRIELAELAGIGLQDASAPPG